MQNIDQPHQSDLNQDWQILGELELTVGLTSDNDVHKWFSVILGLISRDIDLTNKVLRSAQESASRAMHVEGRVSSEHIHLVILIPNNYALNNQSWGFFRIEKIGEPDATLDHTIEFFLYQEGQ